MSGVSAGPAPKSEAEQDLEAAYSGGGNFVTRVQALSDARAASERALADLQLGKAAAAALEDELKLGLIFPQPRPNAGGNLGALLNNAAPRANRRADL